MNIHCFQHVPFEGLGQIETWAKSNGAQISYTRFFANDPLPELTTVDWLIVMGGPMGIYDEAQYPWLATEKAFIRTAIDHNKTVLGICLGAQLIADVLGANVYPNAQKEIGWYPIARAPNTPNWLPEKLTVFHWHGDTFDIPAGAIRLASSAACQNQGFLHGNRIIALQFHIETTAESLEDLIENGQNELTDAPTIQPPRQMKKGLSHLPQIHATLTKMLNSLPQT